MEDFGKRLKKERERLGMSQAKFAEACGVGKTAQFNYERGKRVPSSSYMIAASRLGVDAGYIFGDLIAGRVDAHSIAYAVLLGALVSILGLDEETQEKLLQEHVDSDFLSRMSDRSKLTESGSDARLRMWADDVKRWLLAAKNPETCLDFDLLARILSGIESHALESGMDLVPDRKARATVMLYRAAKASGTVDRRMLEDAVKLAAS